MPYDPALFIDGRYQPNAGGGATFPGAGEDQFDPEIVGGELGQYYGTVLQNQPTFEPIMRNISGVVAPDVKRQIGQAAAERGVGIGSYGGANDASGFLRALGLTSQQLTNTGIEQYRQAFATVPQLRPESLFVSPTDRQQMNLRWAQNQAEIQAALQRQREGDRAALERAQLGQQTAFGTSRIQANTAAARLAAEQAQAERNRQDTLENQARRRADAAAQAELNRQAAAAWYGGQQDPYGAPTITPGGGGSILNPSTGYDSVYGGQGLTGYGGSTGQFYSGAGFDSLQDEYNYLNDLDRSDSYFPGDFGYDVLDPVVPFEPEYGGGDFYDDGGGYYQGDFGYDVGGGGGYYDDLY